MSRRMEKPTICIGENKGADQLRSNCEADHAFVFATLIVQFLYFLNPKFPASNHLLWLYSPVCVRPGRNTKLLAQAHVLTHLWRMHSPIIMILGTTLRGAMRVFEFLFDFLRKFLIANCIASDQTPLSVASHLGLCCLPCPIKKTV